MASRPLRTSSGGADKLCAGTGLQAHFRYDWNDPARATGRSGRVRRLMPVECERLQGMPDDYTLVPYAASRRRARYRRSATPWPCRVSRGWRPAAVAVPAQDGIERFS